MFKRSIFVIALIVLFPLTSFASNYSSEPKKFIEELVLDALNILSDKSKSQEDKTLLIEEIATANVDINALGLYTLGEKRKTIDENTLKKYQGLFEKYFLKSLTSRLSDYSSQKFEVFNSDQKSSNYTIVNSRIVETLNSPEIKVDWRVYTKDPMRPLIRDLIVEGLSLARTQKEEFASILISSNNDMNVLLEKLQEFVKK